MTLKRWVTSSCSSVYALYMTFILWSLLLCISNILFTYCIKDAAEINSMTLNASERIVERYLRLLRLKFFVAITPAKPNNFWVSFVVFTSLGLMIISSL